jgi:hypothetical protein
MMHTEAAPTQPQQQAALVAQPRDTRSSLEISGNGQTPDRVHNDAYRSGVNQRQLQAAKETLVRRHYDIT